MAATLAAAMSASAALTVAELGVSPEQNVNLSIPSTIYPGGFNGGVEAGIYKITIDNVAYDSFCIDLSRQSGASSDYSYNALADSPLAPSGPMGATIATDIEKLWAAHYSPNMGSQDAAALQVAIWNLVVPSATVSGNTPVTTQAATWIADLPNLTATANLRAVVSPTLQNYVVPVPEPTTMIAGALLLLPFGASTLRILRRNRGA